MSAAIRISHHFGARSLALGLTIAIILGGLALNARPAAAAGSTVTATGTFTYVDDSGNFVPIQNAPVTLCDDDGLFGCELMGSTSTDANGNFSVTGFGGDFFNDLPDPMVQVTAKGDWGFIQPLTLVDYCFSSLPVNNAGTTTLAFGNVFPAIGRGCNITGGSTAGTDGAWQLWNNLQEVRSFMRAQTQRNPGIDMPPVRVVWPESIGNHSYYRGPWPGIDSGSIFIAQSDAFDEAVIYHEYGHHVLQHFGESPIPDYNNGVCDTVNFLIFGGHCMWFAEKGYVAWTEGWPSFMAEVLSTERGKNNTISGDFGSIESPPLPSPDPDLAHVEGTVAAIMWDLFDSAMDNRGNVNSTDRLNLSFATLWDVYQGFDPNPFNSHNRILDLDELWNAFAALRPTELNRVSEIYDENGLTKPSADLMVTSVQASDTTVGAGDPIVVWDTTKNVGTVRTGTSSVTRISFRNGPVSTEMGSRTVGDLLPGGTSDGGLWVNIPANAQPGTYSIEVCADNDATTFESNETNNCTSTGVTVVPPSVSIGDAIVWEGNSGTVAMTFPVWLSSPSSLPVTVDYKSANVTAKTSADYTAKIGTLTFAPGETYKTVTVMVKGDVKDEDDETLSVTLSNVHGVALDDKTGVGTILDDDLPPSLKISNVRLAEGQSGTKSFRFKVSLSAASGLPVTVHWSTANGSATAGSDYVSASGTVSIPAGSTSKTLVVKVNGDHTVEPDETFNVNLSSPSNATVAVASGLGTIVNDD